MEVENIDALCQQARQAIAQGKIEQARQLYLQALGLKSDSPDVHYGLATVCFLLEDLDSAAYHFKEVTRLDPLRPGAHINLGAIYNRLEEYDEAIKALRRGIQIDPRRAEGYYNLGLVYKNRGEPNLAIQAYIEATRINPRMVDAHYNLANLYLETGRHHLAVARYKQVLQLRPNWDKAMNGLARAEAAQTPEQKQQPSETTPQAPETPAVTTATADLQRMLNPVAHGSILTNLHQATVESETQGRQFLQILEQEIEPAIKELSMCLLTPSGGTGLDQCVQKFEVAIRNMRSAQRHLQTSIERVRSLGDRLLKT
jgi:tetratricopeptide (TPR) repeat protein